MDSRTRPSARVVIAHLAVLLIVVPATVGALPLVLPEHTETRIRLQELVTGPLSTVAVTEADIHRQRFTPHRVRFSHEVRGEYHYLIFTNEMRGEFRLPTRGSWTIRRHRETGAIDEIKVFLADDQRFFARLAPDGNGRRVTRMEVTLMDDVIYRDVVVPIPFERVLVSSFAEIQRATEAIVDWSLFHIPPDRAAHQTVERMVGRIRASFANRQEGDPAAIDRLIAETGFADADSLGDGRVIAVHAIRFATVVPDVGLPIEDLRRSLYLLVREHPDSFYIGRINTGLRSNGQMVAGSAFTRQHHRLVALFPTVDPRGRFQTVVIDGNAETTVTSLRTRYSGDSIHLVRVRAHDNLFAAGEYDRVLFNEVLLNNE
ncbi:MAG: hypothetical protein EA403_09665 [Spirochaetaceae bacterium]|nr:MAG: hypothetical protein EA403_09665 [Spirochaetaceae bacterium]